MTFIAKNYKNNGLAKPNRDIEYEIFDFVNENKQNTDKH